MINEVNEPDGDYDPIGTELQGLRLMIGDLEARIEAVEKAVEDGVTNGEMSHNELRGMSKMLERRMVVRDMAFVGLEDRVTDLGFTIEQSGVMSHNEILDDFAARLAALESPRTEPPATPWPAPDCAADGEALPVVECALCASPATRIAIDCYVVNKIEVGKSYCGVCGGRPGGEFGFFVTGDPARAILHTIAREAARVRQGGAR